MGHERIDSDDLTREELVPGVDDDVPGALHTHRPTSTR